MSVLKEFTYSKRFPNLPLIAAAFADQHPDLIPLAFGLPAKESFNLSLMQESSVTAIQKGGVKPLEYGGGIGPKMVAEWIKQRLLLRLVRAETNEILVTAGSSQAIDIATRTLTDPGDHIWVEGPSFFGAIRQFLLAETVLTSFPVDEEGLRVDIVEQKLKETKRNGGPMPKMLYVMPNYHNPTGVSLSLDRRKKLAELAYKYNFYVLEDDAYVELSFTGEYVPSIYSFGPERVIYLSTFSKIVAPGIRMGWSVASEPLINKMRMLKSDGSTSVYVQEIVSQFLITIDFDQHIEFLNSIYRSRMKAMVAAIEEAFEDISYIVPEGGFFLWLTFPEGTDTSQFMQESLQKGVSYLDGAHFYLNADEKNHIRLGFTYCNEEEIKRGIERLAESYQEYKQKMFVLEGVKE